METTKIELVRRPYGVYYRLPEKDALGLANYAEKQKIEYENDCKRIDRSFKRFGRIARTSKRAAPRGTGKG